MLDLYFFKNKKQTEISSIFGLTQPTIHCHLMKSSSRVLYILGFFGGGGDEFCGYASDFKVGEGVEVVEGLYEGVAGVVQSSYDNEDHVSVLFDLKSIEHVVDIPKTSLILRST